MSDDGQIPIHFSNIVNENNFKDSTLLNIKSEVENKNITKICKLVLRSIFDHLLENKNFVFRGSLKKPSSKNPLRFQNVRVECPQIKHERARVVELIDGKPFQLDKKLLTEKQKEKIGISNLKKSCKIKFVASEIYKKDKTLKSIPPEVFIGSVGYTIKELLQEFQNRWSELPKKSQELFKSKTRTLTPDKQKIKQSIKKEFLEIFEPAFKQNLILIFNKLYPNRFQKANTEYETILEEQKLHLPKIVKPSITSPKISKLDTSPKPNITPKPITSPKPNTTKPITSPKPDITPKPITSPKPNTSPITSPKPISFPISSQAPETDQKTPKTSPSSFDHNKTPPIDWSSIHKQSVQEWLSRRKTKPLVPLLTFNPVIESKFDENNDGFTKLETLISNYDEKKDILLPLISNYDEKNDSLTQFETLLSNFNDDKKEPELNEQNLQELIDLTKEDEIIDSKHLTEILDFYQEEEKKNIQSQIQNNKLKKYKFFNRDYSVAYYLQGHQFSNYDRVICLEITSLLSTIVNSLDFQEKYKSYLLLLNITSLAEKTNKWRSLIKQYNEHPSKDNHDLVLKKICSKEEIFPNIVETNPDEKHIDEGFKVTQELLHHTAITYCNLSNIETLPRIKYSSIFQIKRASNSVVAEVQYTSLKNITMEAIVKISLDTSDNTLIRERQLARSKLLNEIYEKTPTVVRYLDVFVCANYLKNLTEYRDQLNSGKSIEKLSYQKESEVIELLINELNKINTRKTLTPITFIVVMEKAPGLNLAKFVAQFKKNPLSNTEIKHFQRDIMLQIAYTLYIFKKYGLVHGDLHSDNINVIKVNKGNERAKKINTELKKFGNFPDITYLLTIFDFDRVLKKATKDSPAFVIKRHRVHDCDISEFNDKFDWFVFLTWFLTALANIETKDIKTEVNEKLAYAYHATETYEYQPIFLKHVFQNQRESKQWFYVLHQKTFSAQRLNEHKQPNFKYFGTPCKNVNGVTTFYQPYLDAIVTPYIFLKRMSEDYKTKK